MRGLYPIVDLDTLSGVGIDPVAFLGELMAARPPLVQLRAKSQSSRETLELLRAFRRPTREAGCLLFANDRPDLAMLAEADGVHLGQEDLPAEEVKRCFPTLAIGISTHDLAQLELALAIRPAYVAFGPIWSTSSKRNPDPTVGLAGLARARACVAGRCPLVAIGGVTQARASELPKLAELGAVIGDLLPGSSALSTVADRARKLHAALEGGR